MSVCATRSTWKLSKQQVTSTEKLLLLSLADRANPDGECWPSISCMVNDTCLSENALTKARVTLIAKGMIIYTGEFRGKSKQIPVMKLTYVESRDNHTPPKYGHGKKSTTPKNGVGTPPKSGVRNLKEEPKRKTNMSKTSLDEISQSFEQFWSAYPKKEAKKKAMQIWKTQKCYRNLDIILKDIRRRLDSEEWKDKKFIMQPTKYLNGDRWEDLPKNIPYDGPDDDIAYLDYFADCVNKKITPLTEEEFNKQNGENK